MAEHTINGQAWPDGTLVSVYPAEAQPAGQDTLPAGLAVTSATVAGGRVTFAGLGEGRRYLAYASGASKRFLVQPGSVDTLRPISGSEAQELRALVDGVAETAPVSPSAVGGGSDAAMIQMLVNTAASAIGTRTAQLPPGTYTIDTEVKYPDDVEIAGAGMGSTVLKLATDMSGSHHSIFEGTYTGSSYEVMENVIFRDMTLDGDSMNNAMPAGDTGNPLIVQYLVSGARFYRVCFQNSRSYGLGIQGYPTQANATAAGLAAQDVLVESCVFRWNGFRRTGDSSTSTGAIDTDDTSVTLTDAAAFASPGVGVWTDDQTGEHYEKCTYTKSGNVLTLVRGAFATTAKAHASGATFRELSQHDDGMDFKSSNRVNVIDSRSYGNADDGFDIRSHWVTMTGCFSWENGNAGFSLTVAEAVPGDPVPPEGYTTLNGCWTWENAAAGMLIFSPVGRTNHVTVNGGGGRLNGRENLETDTDAGTGFLHIAINGGDWNQSATAGIMLDACATALVTGAKCRGNATNGITVANMPNGAGIVNCALTGNDRGCRMTGTSDKCRFTGNKMTGNTTQQLTTVGSNSIIAEDNDLGVAQAQTVATAVDFTLTPLTSPRRTTHTGTLTSTTTVGLATANAQVGMTFRVTRTGAGAPLLVFGGLKNLATGTWAEATFNAAGAWELTAYGVLA